MADTMSASPSTNHQPTLLVERVCKRYPRRSWLPLRAGREEAAPWALRDVSFAIHEGETVGLLGPNGAGKTTLLKIVSTLLYPTSGHVQLYGHDVLANPVRARGMMGMVTCEERSFYWRLSGRQNLHFFAALYGLPKRQAAERISTLLSRLDLAVAGERPYYTYSSGMKQKLAIARGLLSSPRLVLYDEPTRSLDPASTQNVRRWMVENRTAAPRQMHLIATNRLDEAEQLCDRVLIINRGTLIAHGTIQDIRTRWRTRDYDIHRISYRGFQPNGAFHQTSESGLIDIEEEPPGPHGSTLRLRTQKGSSALSRVLAKILEAGGTIVRCDAEEPRFDEVFCALLRDDAGAPPRTEREPQP